jgi:hypothetical protein
VREGDWPLPVQFASSPDRDPDQALNDFLSGTWKDTGLIVNVYFTDGSALLNFRVEEGIVKNVPLEWIDEKMGMDIGIKELNILKKFTLA